MRRGKQYGGGRFVKTLAVLLIIAVVIVAAAFAAPEIISRYRRGEADKAIEEGRIERAIELLLPELERSSKDINLRLELVDLYVSAGNYSRAEYLLSKGMRELGGQTELYRGLCAIYVQQDKLYDAVTLLNGLQNPFVKETIERERPAPPVFDPPPGDFREALKVSATCEQGNVIYMTADGSVPSTRKPYEHAAEMPQGITELRAVAVSPDGLVSDWAEAKYRLDDVLELVEFEDSVIERVVREMLGIPSGLINSGRLQGITELELPEAEPYETLNDLRFFTYLERLSLNGNDAHDVDISALAGLPRLTSLTLNRLGIDSFDLEIIGQMTWLTELDLSGNRIVSIEPMSELRSLETLILSDNHILSIEPLERVTSLKTLLLDRNGIEDTSPLALLTKIESLNINENRVRWLSGLANMTSLVELDLSGNSIVSADHLKNLESLETLNLSANKELTDVRAVGNLSRLTTLYANGCAISSVETFGTLTALKTLWLDENTLVNLVGLEGAVSLEFLSANKNVIESLRALQNLTKLSELHVEHNKLPSLVAIKDMSSLKSVYAFGNPLTETVIFSSGIVPITSR